MAAVSSKSSSTRWLRRSGDCVGHVHVQALHPECGLVHCHGPYDDDDDDDDDGDDDNPGIPSGVRTLQEHGAGALVPQSPGT